MNPVIIGNATLYCGDCREVLPTLLPLSVDMVMTDPPYGHNNNNGDLIHKREVALGKQAVSECGRPIENDGAEANEVLSDALPTIGLTMKKGSCCCCCCGGGGPDPQFARWSMMLDDAIGFKMMVVWDKGPMGMGWHYRRSYETVLIAEKPGAACKWYDTTDAVENIIRPRQNGIRKIIPHADDHPTPKPVALAEHFIKLHSLPGDVVLDPFMGAGWVGDACTRLGRSFIGIELDPHWFDVACRRIEKAQSDGPLFEPRKPKQEHLF